VARAKLIFSSDVALSASDQLQATRSACPIDPARDVETATEAHLDGPSLTTGRHLEKLCPAPSTPTSFMRRQCWLTSSCSCRCLGTRLVIFNSRGESATDLPRRPPPLVPCRTRRWCLSTSSGPCKSEWVADGSEVESANNHLPRCKLDVSAGRPLRAHAEAWVGGSGSSAARTRVKRRWKRDGVGVA